MAPPGPGLGRSSPGSLPHLVGSQLWSPLPAWSKQCCLPPEDKRGSWQHARSQQGFNEQRYVWIRVWLETECEADLCRGDDWLYQKVSEGLIIYRRQDSILHQTHLQAQRSQLTTEKHRKKHCFKNKKVFLLEEKVRHKGIQVHFLIKNAWDQ